MLATLAVLSALAIAPYVPANVVAADAPLDRFSAERALPHLAAIAQQPRAVGSPGHAVARAYLQQQISQLELDPQVQHATVWDAPNDRAIILDNVLVRLRGARSTPAVLVTAHYDSVASTPGVADNAMLVAAMLETIRALKTGPALRNDIIFLFNDAEEPGMWGSTAFIQQHPWASDVGVVFDFDGDSPVAPTTLLWTTPGDGWLVSELARAGGGLAAPPTDNDAKRATRGQDLHVFAEAGYTGAHFDLDVGKTYYHNPRDNLSNLDLRAVQDQGDVMLAVAQHFGNLPLDQDHLTSSDATTFSLMGPALVSYPFSWTVGLTVLATAAVIGASIFGLWRGQISPRNFGLATAALCVTALGTGVLGHFAWQAILAVHPESRIFQEHDFYGQVWYASGFLLIVLALVLMLWPRLTRRVGEVNLAAAGVIGTAAFASVLLILLPRIAHLAIWPALVGAAGLLYLLIDDVRRATWLRVAVLAVVAAPTIGLIVGSTYAAIIGGVEGSPAVQIVALVLTLGLLAPQVLLATAVARRVWPAVAGLVGVGLLTVGVLNSGFNAAQPWPDTAGYIMDATSGQAFWVTSDPRLDAWTGQLLEHPAPRTIDDLIGAGGSATLLSSAAPLAQLSAPTLEVLAQHREGDLRTLSAHLTSARSPWRVLVLPPPGTELVTAGVNDLAPAPIGGGSLTILGLPPEGVDVTLIVRGSGAVSFVLADQTIGLPELPGVPSRPTAFMAAPGPDDLLGYATYVATRVTLPEPPGPQ